MTLSSSNILSIMNPHTATGLEIVLSVVQVPLPSEVIQKAPLQAFAESRLD
jgi:hypothetical protein